MGYSVRVFLFLFFASFTILACGQQHTELTPRIFLEQIKGNDVQLVDVRTSGEYNTGHIEHAVNIDWNSADFKEKIKALNQEKPVYVYCLSGGRSAAAAQYMRDAGFSSVSELKGGMMSWRAEKLPEVSGVQPAEEISLQQYKSMLESDKFVLVDFYADWCVPCKKMKPYLEQIATEMQEDMVLIRIDADQNPKLCAALKVSGLPVLKLYRKKKLVWEHVGFIAEDKLRAKFK